MITRLHSPARVLCMAALLVFTGCSRQSTIPSASDTLDGGAERLLGPDIGSPSDMFGRGRGGSFYPLAIGNQWTYSIRSRWTIVTEAGAQPPVVTQSPWIASITGTAVTDTRTYFIQAEYDARVVGPGPGPGPASTILMREDRSGLYEADQFIRATPTALRPTAATQWRASMDPAIAGTTQSAAFARAADVIAARLDLAMGRGMSRPGPGPGGPDPGEISMLRYPLRLGARWVVRDSPLFTRTVVARETVHLPAGVFDSWKLRGDSELFGSTDRVHFWYGRAGLLRIRFHAEAEATDEAGNSVGRLIVDQDQVLTALELHRPDAPHTFAN